MPVATPSLLPNRIRSADAVTLSCKLAKASLPGEGQDEGNHSLKVAVLDVLAWQAPCAALDGGKQSGYGPPHDRLPTNPHITARGRTRLERIAFRSLSGVGDAMRPLFTGVSHPFAERHMLIIFDCDGVVVDSMHLHNEVESQAYEAIGINISPKELSLRFSGVGDSEVYRIISQETGRAIPPDFAGEIERRKKEVFRQRLKPVAGFREALTAIDDMPRCIASGTGVDLLFYTLGIVELYDLFAPHIYSTEMVLRGKPFPDLFLHAANEMGHAPEACLVIEDGIAGVLAGRAAGMRVFGFIGGSHCDEEHTDRLKAAGAELVYSDMRELPALIEQLDGM